MSEQELNSYRFLSGEEPTDEMLQAIMSDARDAAVKRAEEAQLRFEADYERLYAQTREAWEERLARYRNGIN